MFRYSFIVVTAAFLVSHSFVFAAEDCPLLLAALTQAQDGYCRGSCHNNVLRVLESMKKLGIDLKKTRVVFAFHRSFNPDPWISHEDLLFSDPPRLKWLSTAAGESDFRFHVFVL